MSRLTRFDPFGDLDEMFKGFALSPLRPDWKEPTIRVDVSESDDCYKVHADIPGVKKEDISVDIDGNVVSISAEVHRSSEKKDGERVLRSERYTGKASRSFSLGNEISESGAKAEYQDGVLHLTLPKVRGGRAKQLKVS